MKVTASKGRGQSIDKRCLAHANQAGDTDQLRHDRIQYEKSWLIQTGRTDRKRWTHSKSG